MKAVDDAVGAAVETIGGVRTGFVMAASAEFGSALRARIQPFLVHVGPVEAAARTAMLLARADIDLVVSLGSAGSATLEQGSVHQASHVSWRDIDASPLGFERGVTPFLDLPATLPVPLAVPGVPRATLSTGADIVSGERYTEIGADMVDMESWAVLRACMLAGAGFVGLRGISDGAEPLDGLSDWTRYLHVVDERLAGAVDRLVSTLEEGGIEALRTQG